MNVIPSPQVKLSTLTHRFVLAWTGMIGACALGLVGSPNVHADELSEILCGLNVLHRELNSDILTKEQLRELKKNPELVPNVGFAVGQLRGAGRDKKAAQLLEKATKWIDRIKDEDLNVSLADIDAAFRLRCLR